MREGIDQFLNPALSDEDQFDVYGAKTFFREITSSLVKKTVNAGKWFSFCTRIDKRQYDVMSFKNEEGQSLGSFTSEIYPETVYRSAIYKYLLRDYMCYYESPTKVRYGSKDDGVAFKSSYDKFIATSNVYVVAEWLGIDVCDAQAIYGSRLDECYEDNGCDMFPYVKLYMASDGTHKVSKPRKDLDLSLAGTRVIPMYALEIGVGILYSYLSKDFYRVDFYKDSGQFRNMNVTFNIDRLRSIYNDGENFRVAVEGMYSGDFLENRSLDRGNISVFEAGASKYNVPLRKINYARIVSFEREDPELTFVNIDLEDTINVFRKYSTYLYNKVDVVIESFKDYWTGDITVFGRKPKTMEEFTSWVEDRYNLVGTVFQQHLALFMLGNPQWFGGYTGEPNVITTSMGENLDEISDEEFSFDISM